MSMVRRLQRATAGSTVIEFALVASTLILCMYGIIMGCLMLWTLQGLQSAATDAARCAGIIAQACQNVATSPAGTINYAVASASARGINGVTATATVVTIIAVDPRTNTTPPGPCGLITDAHGFGLNAVNVTVSYTFAAAIILPPLSPTLTASACFPLAA
jgi:Flp pilus assembly protein TadG